MSNLPSPTTFDEYLNDQLINCLNLQTNVIQNLAQYSQHISFQLIEIKNTVNILANRIMTLEEQQAYIQIPPPLSNPLLFFPLPLQISSPLSKPLLELPTQPAPFSFSTTTDEQPSRNAPFVFGSISSYNVKYQDDDDDNNPYEPTIPFKPIIKLSPVENKTGEEEENILFCERAKLYRFDPSTNQLKERGTGEIKILQHKSKPIRRVLMRREQVFKVCANHNITSQMELKPYQGTGNVYLWSAIDFADGDGKHETLCVKFKTDEQAKQFAKVFNESKEITGDLPTIGNISLNDDDDEDIILIAEIQPTIEQIERAKKFQLPLTFYLYKNKEPCPGCRGCRNDYSFNEIPFTNRMNSYFPSAFFSNSSLPTLMSMLPTWLSDGLDSYNQTRSPPKDYRMIIKAKRSLPSNRLPPPSVPSSYEQTSLEVISTDDAAAVQTNQKKSRNFSGYNPETYSVNDYASQIAENILDRVKQELCKIRDQQIQEDNNKPSISVNAGFSFTNFDTTTTSTTDFQFLSNSRDTSTTFKFGNKPKLSFLDLVKQSSDDNLTNNETEERVFPGQGSLLFGANTTDNKDDDDANASYEPTIAFKPIVKLSPVEIKTGEEEENILFCERAKLYRFDPLTNEMKERGIGEMKILQHKTKNLYRVLMRREQVLKVCANHKITSQMELKPHQGSENAYVWSANDFSDGKEKHETLCVKFKTSDIAKRFFQQFNNAKVEQ